MLIRSLLINRLEVLEAEVVTVKIRRLAVVAGSSCAVFGVASFGYLFPILGAFVVIGAIVQPRALTTGRWLMWLGALLLTLISVPYGSKTVLEDAKMLGSIHDSSLIVMFSLAVVSVVSVLCCDVALVVEGVKSRRHQWVRGRLDWVVWISAVTLSAWCLWTGLLELGGNRLHDRRETPLATVGLDTAVLLFDCALVIHAFKCRHPRK